MSSARLTEPSTVSNQSTDVCLRLHSEPEERSQQLTGVESALLEKVFVSVVTSMEAFDNFMRGIQGNPVYNKLGPVFKVWFNTRSGFQSEGKINAGGYSSTVWSWKDWVRVRTLVKLSVTW